MEIKACNTDGWRGDREEVSAGSDLPCNPLPGLELIAQRVFLWAKGVKQDKGRM